MPKTIHVLCNDGSPISVTSKTIYGDNFRLGVGGAELALLTMCEAWAMSGNNVVLFNNPHERNASPFEQRNISEFSVHDSPDILIAFRSPNIKAVVSKAKQKIWWSCDQQTVGDFPGFGQQMRKIVVISKYHQDYFLNRYGIRNTTIIDLPVRTYEYQDDLVWNKPDPYHFLFSSVPDRGLDALWRMWPLIKAHIPQAHVTITSDYRLWGSRSPGNERYRMRWSARDDFNFLGAINRKQLVQEQMKASALVYPCIYDELFCIAVAEAQVAGAIPFTTGKGALITTNMGVIANGWDANDARGDVRFVELLENLICADGLSEYRSRMVTNALQRFSINKILHDWELLFEE